MRDSRVQDVAIVAILVGVAGWSASRLDSAQTFSTAFLDFAKSVADRGRAEPAVAPEVPRPAPAPPALTPHVAKFGPAEAIGEPARPDSVTEPPSQTFGRVPSVPRRLEPGRPAASPSFASRKPSPPPRRLPPARPRCEEAYPGTVEVVVFEVEDGFGIEHGYRPAPCRSGYAYRPCR